MVLVSIVSLAYNHAPFIRQCLDGFVMQKTNFNFEVLIHDDASMDETADIIREYEKKYPDIIKPIYQTENQYSKGVKILADILFPSAKGRYIALCEGDDYWTDPYKLQKQVDFLEANPDYVMCSHNFKVYHEEKKTFIIDSYYDNYSEQKNCTYTLDEYFNLWYTQPLTCIFRNGSYLNKIPHKKYKYFRDNIFFYYVLKEGKGILMSEIMAAYRKHSNGIFSGNSKINNHHIEADNLLNLYKIEKDKRSFNKLIFHEREYIYWNIAQKGKMQALKELVTFLLRVPLHVGLNLIKSILLIELKNKRFNNR